MKQFTDFNLSIYIASKDATVGTRINASLKQANNCNIVATPEDANFCIVDASIYLASSSFYDKHFDACLKLLLPEHYEQLDQLLSSKNPFYLRHDFTAYELTYQLKLIQEHLQYKFQNQVLSTLYNAAQNSIVITNTEGQIVFANTYFLKATGYSSDEVLGNLPKLIKSNVHEASFYQKLWTTIQSGSIWNGFFINRRKNGRFFYEEATISPIFNTSGTITNYIKIGKLVNRERLLSDQLSQEFKTAKNIMAYMLPPDYKDANVHFEAKAKAYNYLGGDFICFEQISPTKYAMALLDVMGHGTSATLIGLKAISTFQSSIHYDTLENAVAKTNASICQVNQNDISSLRYLSGIFLEIDLSNQTVNYVNAGHPDFYIQKRKQLKTVSSNNIILGVNCNMSYVIDTFAATDLEYIFLYSDGLVEHPNEKGDTLNAQLEQALMQIPTGDMTFTQHILNALLGDRTIDDDITLCRLSFFDHSTT